MSFPEVPLSELSHQEVRDELGPLEMESETLGLRKMTDDRVIRLKALRKEKTKRQAADKRQLAAERKEAAAARALAFKKKKRVLAPPYANPGSRAGSRGVTRERRGSTITRPKTQSTRTGIRYKVRGARVGL